MVKNSKFAPFMDALNDFLDPPVDRASMVNLSAALMNMAEEVGIPIDCTIDSQHIQSRGGGGGEKILTVMFHAPGQSTVRTNPSRLHSSTVDT
jgi:hypothetical protein